MTIDTMTTRILRLPDVKTRTGLSRSTIYALIKNKRFPECINLGARSVGWLESEIEAWIESRVNATRITNIAEASSTGHF